MNNYFLIITPFLCLLILVYCYFRFSKGNNLKLEFSKTPPNNLDILELSFLLKGFITDNDIVSLLICLANEGYINFIGNKENFTIIKVKEYKENNLVKKILMKKLFSEKNELELRDIKYKFNTTMYEIKKLVNDKHNKEMIFETKLKKYRFLINMLMIISVFAINIKIPIDSDFLKLFILILMNIVVLFIMRRDTQNNDRILLGIILLGVNIYLNKNLFININNYTILYIIELITIVINAIMYIKLPTRTKYGNEYLGKIIGFKLELERMNLNNITEDKNIYFYKMIPYAYVFGIFDKWINKGKKVIKKKPKWHITNEEFDLINFKRFVQTVLFKTMQAMLKEKSFTLVTYEKPNRIREMYED